MINDDLAIRGLIIDVKGVCLVISIKKAEGVKGIYLPLNSE